MRRKLALLAIASGIGAASLVFAPAASANYVTIGFSCTAITFTYGDVPAGEQVTAQEDVLVNGAQIEWLTPYTFTGTGSGVAAVHTVPITVTNGDTVEAYSHFATSDGPDFNDHLGPMTVSGCSTTYTSPLTPGYWKNHQAATTALLPQNLGGYTVDTFAKAQAVFGAMNCASSTTQGAIACLAGHLLATELNLANGSDPSINSVVTAANQMLTNVGYAGPGTPLGNPSAYDRQLALSLKTQLDTYNNS